MSNGITADGFELLSREDKLAFATMAVEFTSEIPYCPWVPNEREDPRTGEKLGPGPQHFFLCDFGKEGFYGGAVGGGKSIALMMAASQFLHVPGYAALLLRKSYTDLVKPGALMDIADGWWGGVDGVRFDRSQHTYFFEAEGGGQSRIVFGSLDNENDRFKYQGGAFQFVGFDELTQHKERDYRYLFSRMRKTKEGPKARIPIRMRSTGNPGGVGHEWVAKRFIAPWEAWQKGVAYRPRANFHPATLADNTKLDKEDYVASLMELDPITRAQLLRGDWNIRPDGRMFKRSWFKQVRRDQVPGDCVWVRFWDMASTEASPGKDPDFTAGALVGKCPRGNYYIADMRHWREDPATNDLRCKATSLVDTRRVQIAMEQEPGASGVIAIHHYRVHVFGGMSFRGVPARGKGKGTTTVVSATGRTPRAKIVAAGPVASQADAGTVHMVVDGSWDHEAFLAEIEMFPDAMHDDQVDSLSGAFSLLDYMYSMAVNMGAENEEFETPSFWTPDVTVSSLLDGDKSIADFSGQITIDRARAETQAAMEMQRLVSAAWSM